MQTTTAFSLPQTLSPATTLASSVACRANAVWFAYRNDAWILRDISLQIPVSGFLTILGASGSGKTTLLKILAGILSPQRGSVELLGQTLNENLRATSALRQQVGYIPQQLGLVRGMTTLENVLLGAVGRMNPVLPLLGIFPKREIERAREYLNLLGIVHKASEPVYRLSGGERQRVAIARTLLQQPRIVFADEFVSDLDLPRAAQVLQAMRDLSAREQIAFVINLHEIPLVQEIGDQVVILKQGTIVERSTAHDLSFAHVREVLE